jgi:iron-sulfur cluster repair protein YtfE (RIC family)
VKPAEIRRRILADHAKLRAMLDALVPLAQRFERGEDVDAKWLREEALALYETFAAHLLHEESTLEPALRARGEDGERLAERLAHEHREQRELLGYLTSRLRESPHPTLLVAREVRNFAEYLRSDMAHEESTLLSAASPPEER